VGRFLIVVPPLVGHTNPTVPLGRELARRGHAVAWCGYAAVAEELLPPSATLLPIPDPLPPALLAALDERAHRGPGGVLAYTTMFTDFVLPVARVMLPGVHAAVETFDPDVLVVDEIALAGVAVAELRGLPWVTSATSSGDLVDPLPEVPKLGRWVRDQTRALLVEAGVDPGRAAAVDPLFSPHLILAFTVPELVGPAASLPEHVAFVGPSFGLRPSDPPFPWEWLDGTEQLVLVTLGTVNRAGERFFAAAAAVLAELGERGVKAVVVAPPDLLPDPPPNVLVLPRVPQLALLGRAAAVVCHAGHNTVCESLAHGAPLVVAPIRDDQPVVAGQVVRAGVGVRVKYGRVTVPMLREALDAVLTDPRYRTAAERVRASLTAAGGPAAAADRLEGLIAAVGAR